eukprot:SAG22_NODE_70_length_22717_cov_12.413741_15_plen_170_part_00
MLCDTLLTRMCHPSVGEHTNDFDPIVSPDRLVLAPHSALGFSGPSADLLTHAWFRAPAALDAVWPRLPRCVFSHQNKVGFAFSLLGRLTICPVASQIPGGLELPVMETVYGEGGLPAEAAQHILKNLAPLLLARYPLRYTDSRPAAGAPVPALPPGYGGQLPQPQLARL